MRTLGIAASLVLMLMRGAAADAPAMDAVSKVTRVTVYADRARVTRAAALDLPKGTATVVFRKLPGWIDEDSVRAALLPADGASILDVRVQRDYLAQADDEKLVAAEQAAQTLRDEAAALDDDLRILERQDSQLESIRVFSMEKLPKDAALRDINVESYGAVVTFISDKLRETARARRELLAKKRELDPKLKVREKELAELRGLTQLEQTTIFAVVTSDAARKAAFELTYMLPGATWEAAHELRANGAKPERVELVSHAVVTQTTGEDWNGAELSFSTQSPGEVIQIPEVDALLLGGHLVGQAAVAKSVSSFQKAAKVFEGQNRNWFNYVNPNEDLNDFIGNLKQQKETQSRASAVFERLRERGTTAHFKGQGAPLVRSDGRPVRVRIGRMEPAAQHAIIAAPEVSLNAMRTVRLSNDGEQPLLPGRASLFQDGAFLGITDLAFTAPGESFPVLLGVADQLKLTRTLDRGASSIERNASTLGRGRKTRMQIAFDLTVENLGTDRETVDLTDRIPVSENEDIRVYRVDITPDIDPDSKGLLKWNLTLEPHAAQKLRIEYTIEYPSDFIARRRQVQTMMQQAPMDAPAEMAEPANDLSVQIEGLEARF